MSTAVEETDEVEPAPARPARGRTDRRLRRKPTPNRRTTLLVAAGLAAVGIAGTVWSVPATRQVLLDSFTERSASFTELYFTSDPTFDGATLIVPIALNAHGTGIGLYHIRVTLESPDGKALATTTVDLTPRDGTSVPVVARLQTNAGNAALVKVDLVGHPQSLHFRFGKAQTPPS